MTETEPFRDATTNTLQYDRTRSTTGRVLRLDVVRGPDAGAYAVVNGPTSVGKSSACELLLTDPSVSRRHLQVTPAEQGGLRLVDLSSMNGVFVNGSRVFEGIVDDGARIELGETVIEVRSGEGPIESHPMRTRFGRMVGASAPMRALYAKCDTLAPTNIPMLIEGETGTGKELLAEAIHEASTRANKPFVVFDCTTVSSQLVEAHLFGHERGAFTGAIESRSGVFEDANGGTLLIDEIGDLEVALQAKLLRAAERQEVQRVGSMRWRRVDVRLISATRRDLESEIAAGRFRDDLYFRIAVARVMVPPLRARESDLALIAGTVWEKLAGAGERLPDDLLPRYASYRWPGNVRELVNVVQRRYALGSGAAWQEEPATYDPQSSDFFEQTLATNPPYTVARRLVIEEFERRFVDWALLRSGGNVTKAAQTYGIARRYFTRIKARTR